MEPKIKKKFKTNMLHKDKDNELTFHCHTVCSYMNSTYYLYTFAHSFQILDPDISNKDTHVNVNSLKLGASAGNEHKTHI